MFLDGSLAEMGIHTVADLRARFREREGCWVTYPATFPGCWHRLGRWGKDNTLPMAGALLYPDRLFPVTIGDGGLGSPM
jgi:phosphoketolase